jgi:hypothetical protein
MEDNSAVRQALEGLRARPCPAPVAFSRGTLAPDPLASAGLLALLLAIVVVVFVAASGPGTSARACSAITYAFEGSPPPEVRTEFVAAAHEISRTSGLRFTPAAQEVSRLSVAWVAEVRVAADGASSAGQHSTVVGRGIGRWHTEGIYRVLDGAAIQINSAWDWSSKRPAGDMLRAVLIHELGHVVGLRHNADPASYMYAHTRATPQHWTAEEQRALKAIGSKAGCS